MPNAKCNDPFLNEHTDSLNPNGRVRRAEFKGDLLWCDLVGGCGWLWQLSHLKTDPGIHWNYAKWRFGIALFRCLLSACCLPFFALDIRKLHWILMFVPHQDPQERRDWRHGSLLWRMPFGPSPIHRNATSCAHLSVESKSDFLSWECLRKGRRVLEEQADQQSMRKYQDQVPRVPPGLLFALHKRWSDFAQVFSDLEALPFLHDVWNTDIMMILWNIIAFFLNNYNFYLSRWWLISQLLGNPECAQRAPRQVEDFRFQTLQEAARRQRCHIDWTNRVEPVEVTRAILLYHSNIMGKMVEKHEYLLAYGMAVAYD